MQILEDGRLKFRYASNVRYVEIAPNNGDVGTYGITISPDRGGTYISIDDYEASMGAASSIYFRVTSDGIFANTSGDINQYNSHPLRIDTANRLILFPDSTEIATEWGGNRLRTLSLDDYIDQRISWYIN